MPIPPRPIPNASRARPGSSVPRKSLASLDKLDWRSEVSILNDYPRSLPTSGPSGVRLEKSLPTPLVGKTVQREVELEGLIADNMGKREKRTTTATTLGFDFIPNPSILALPDIPAPRITTPESLLSTTKHIPGAFPTKGRTSPALSTTPATPALIPHRPQQDDEDDLDEWEHIDALALREPSDGEERDRADSQSEEDVIVLGELELEDEFDMVDARRAKRHAAKGVLGFGKARQGVTYAAAAGAIKQ